MELKLFTVRVEHKTNCIKRCRTDRDMMKCVWGFKLYAKTGNINKLIKFCVGGCDLERIIRRMRCKKNRGERHKGS